MNELYREIEEDIRQERIDRIWRGFGKVMVWASVAIVVMTIIVVVWQDRRQAHAMEETALFMKGIDRLSINDYKGAIKVFDTLTNDPSSSFYGMAMLRKAEAQAQLDDKAGAQQTYKQLAQKDDTFGDLAKMMVAGDTKPIDPAKNSPLYYSLKEWGAWQLLGQGKKDEAVNLFLAIYNDDMAPHSVRERMQEALEHIAPDKLGKHPAENLAALKVSE